MATQSVGAPDRAVLAALTTLSSEQREQVAEAYAKLPQVQTAQGGQVRGDVVLEDLRSEFSGDAQILAALNQLSADTIDSIDAEFRRIYAQSLGTAVAQEPSGTQGLAKGDGRAIIARQPTTASASTDLTSYRERLSSIKEAVDQNLATIAKLNAQGVHGGYSKWTQDVDAQTGETHWRPLSHAEILARPLPEVPTLAVAGDTATRSFVSEMLGYRETLQEKHATAQRDGDVAVVGTLLTETEALDRLLSEVTGTARAEAATGVNDATTLAQRGAERLGQALQMRDDLVADKKSRLGSYYVGTVQPHQVDAYVQQMEQALTDLEGAVAAGATQADLPWVHMHLHTVNKRGLPHQISPLGFFVPKRTSWTLETQPTLQRIERLTAQIASAPEGEVVASHAGLSASAGRDALVRGANDSFRGVQNERGQLDRLQAFGGLGSRSFYEGWMLASTGHAYRARLDAALDVAERALDAGASAEDLGEVAQFVKTVTFWTMPHRVSRALFDRHTERLEDDQQMQRLERLAERLTAQ